MRLKLIIILIILWNLSKSQNITKDNIAQVGFKNYSEENENKKSVEFLIVLKSDSVALIKVGESEGSAWWLNPEQDTKKLFRAFMKDYRIQSKQRHDSYDEVLIWYGTPQDSMFSREVQYTYQDTLYTNRFTLKIRSNGRVILTQETLDSNIRLDRYITLNDW